jgi:hypothetical protein
MVWDQFANTFENGSEKKNPKELMKKKHKKKKVFILKKGN